MTFNHIVLKNLRQNLKHYAMYLFSLFLASSYISVLQPYSLLKV